MSTPRATASSMSSGVPTPIKYLGRSCGRIGTTSSSLASISDVGSPPPDAPVADALTLLDHYRHHGLLLAHRKVSRGVAVSDQVDQALATGAAQIMRVAALF